jgi:nucleoside-diphosphate-sugar epimerase
VVKEGLKGEVIIVGSPNEITILELAQPVKKLTESKIQDRVPPQRPDDSRVLS